jgi:hypothetical protein
VARRVVKEHDPLKLTKNIETDDVVSGAARFWPSPGTACSALFATSWCRK